MAGITGMQHGHKPVYDYKSKVWRCDCGQSLMVTIIGTDMTVTRYARTQTEARQAMSNHRRNLSSKGK